MSGAVIPETPRVERAIHPGDTLEDLLAQGRFALTAEIAPPRGADPEFILRKAEALRGHVDAVNVTDNQTARVAMSSLAAALLIKRAGLEPVVQVQTRDRNRLALQSDILGASALGVRNLLCLGGDPIHIGNDPSAKAVHDIDATGLIALARKLRDEGRDSGGAELSLRPHYAIAGTCNPFGGSEETALDLLEAKLEAGADFFQTQAIYDVQRFAQFLDAARSRGILPRARILAGVVPVKSAKMAHHLAEKVPGIVIPPETLARFDGADDAPALGVEHAAGLLSELKELRDVAGVHVMAVAWEERVPEILSRAGLKRSVAR